MAQTRSTFGATFSIGSPLVEIAHVTNITPPPITRETSEIRYHDAALDFPELIKGAAAAGEATVELGFDANDTNGQMKLYDAAKSGDLQACEIGVPNTSPAMAWAFSAIVTSFEQGSLDAASNVQRATVKLRVSGEPNLAV